MDKLDFVKQDKQFYAPAKTPEIVDVPEMQYLTIEGQGMPENNPAFQQAFAALYGIAYTIKFAGKKPAPPAGWIDFKVPPPEGLWWMAGNQPFDSAAATGWRWTLMIRMPAFVTAELVRQAADELAAKKHDTTYQKVSLLPLREGKSVQMLHVGPYSTETADIAAMQAYATAAGYQTTGKHHEIYFGDPRRSAPEKLRTVLRQPLVAV